MKKFFSFVIALMFAINLCAQDIIVTTDAKKIEAKILEVSKSEIKYKEADNLNGPTFIISTDEISSVIYANGKVTLYNSAPKEEDKVQTPSQQATISQPVTATKEAENTATIQLLTGETINAQIQNVSNSSVTYLQNNVSYTIPASQISTVTFANGQVKSYNISAASDENNKVGKVIYVSRSGNTYYYNGMAMDGDDYSKFLKQNCAEAYNLYRNGNNISYAGWILFSVGVGIDLGTLIGGLATGNFGNGGSPALTAISIVGLGCEIACIPTLIVGYHKKHRSVDIYNSSCALKNQPQAYWSIKTSQNGIGIALNF